MKDRILKIQNPKHTHSLQFYWFRHFIKLKKCPTILQTRKKYNDLISKSQSKKHILSPIDFSHLNRSVNGGQMRILIEKKEPNNTFY